MIRATSIIHSHDEPADCVVLDYEDRMRRRMVMTGENGTRFLLDLEQVTELKDGDSLLLEDGRHIRVKAAPEDLMQATCKDALHLIATAWHVGNRHLPCEVHEDRLVLRSDHVIKDMLEKLGCEVVELSGPFNPLGGAYGAGAVHGHSHGHGHSHPHNGAHDHSH